MRVVSIVLLAIIATICFFMAWQVGEYNSAISSLEETIQKQRQTINSLESIQVAPNVTIEIKPVEPKSY